MLLLICLERRLNAYYDFLFCFIFFGTWGRVEGSDPTGLSTFGLNAYYLNKFY